MMLMTVRISSISIVVKTATFSNPVLVSIVSPSCRFSSMGK